MVVGIDEARQHDLASEIDDRIGRGGELYVGSDLLDDAVLRIESGILQFTARAVHGDKNFRILG